MKSGIRDGTFETAIAVMMQVKITGINNPEYDCVNTAGCENHDGLGAISRASGMSFHINVMICIAEIAILYIRMRQSQVLGLRMITALLDEFDSNSVVDDKCQQSFEAFAQMPVNEESQT